MLLFPKKTKEEIIEGPELATLFHFFPEGLVAIDLETTGLSCAFEHIIEIGALKITPEKTDYFKQLIRPSNPIPKRSTLIHGITNKMVDHSPPISEVISQFNHFLGNLPIVAHNAQFDIGFLIKAFDTHKIKIPESKVYCSIKFSRAIFKEIGNYRLQHLIKVFNLPITEKHRAFHDALACLKIFVIGLDKLNSLEVTEQKKQKMINSSEIYSLKDFKSPNNYQIPEKLIKIKESIANQDFIQIKYRGGSLKNEFRPIRPLALLIRPDGPVLYAECLLSQLNKNFILSKIIEFKGGQAT
jgi:DNA polymerase III subunit epsilon